MLGAKVRYVPDMDDYHVFTEESICQCAAKHPTDIQEGIVNGVKCSMFIGCQHILDGTMEAEPNEWKKENINLANIEADFWESEKETSPTKYKIKDLIAKPGKIREFKNKKIAHEQNLKPKQKHEGE